MNTLIKSAAIASTIALTAGAATAGNFALQNQVMDDSVITIDLIRADEAGTVVIYDYSTGEFGDVLGTADVFPGANDDVKIQLDVNTATEIAAVLYEGDVTSPADADAWIELEVDS